MLRRLLVVLIAGLALAATEGEASSQACERPCVGSPGGSEAKIVLIPTAGARYGSHDGWTAIEALQKAGVLQLEVLHTRSRVVADLVAFAAPLKEATGVWFSGESQFRLVDVYRDTETHGELWAVLVTRRLAEVLGNRIAV